jgi:hypothetical protein
LNGRVSVFETGLEGRIVRGERGHRREMPARRPAGDRDEVGIAAVVGDVVADPRERPLHVDEVRRKSAARALAVVDRDTDPAEFDHLAHQRVRLPAFAVHGPRPAGDLKQHRRAAAGRQVVTPPDVEQVFVAARAVRDV